MDFLRSIGWREVVEIGLISLVMFAILRFLRGTRGLGILKGVVFLIAVLYLSLQLSTRAFGMENIQNIVKAFLTGSLFLIIVVFQPELRRAFVQLGRNPLVRFLMRTESPVIDSVCRAAAFLASERSGALIVVTRQHGLGHIIETGVRLDAEVSSELLCTIFHPGAQLHDLAVVIRMDRVVAARCRLPLSDNPAIARQKGTRHLAAVGITEESDAVTVIVSEETGRISVAASGQLFEGLTAEQLKEALRNLLAERELPAEAAPTSTPVAPSRPGGAGATAEKATSQTAQPTADHAGEGDRG